MDSIQQFLEKYRQRLFGEEEKRKSIVSIVKECTRIGLKDEQIKIKKGVLRLDVDPVTRNELFLYRDLILRRCKEKNIVLSEIQ